MSVETIQNVTCDGDRCRKKRDGDSNHWLVGFSEQGYIVLGKDRSAIDHEPVADEAIKDFCGEQCAIKWVSKMLTEIKKVKK